MPPRPRWWHMLEESKRQALVAIDFYNRSGDKRSLHDFVVHMHLAWLHLLHAEFEQAGTPYVYRTARGRIMRIDGEPKTWDLERCLAERYAANDPVRANLEFFVALRNKIEHRYQHALAAVTSGMSHALVINYEAERVARFGRDFSLAGELRFPVFLETLPPPGVNDLRKATRTLPRATRNFLTRYRNTLDSSVRDSDRFDYRLMLTPLKGPKAEADLAVTFVRSEDLTEQKAREMRAAGQVGVAITIEKQRDVLHKDELAPAQVVELVDAQVPYVFQMWHHTRLVAHHRLKPDPADPARTDVRYCLYDRPWRKHVYTQAWVRNIVADYGTPDQLAAVVGKAPVRKVTELRPDREVSATGGDEPAGQSVSSSQPGRTA
jgi:hypothetical protein